MWTKTLVLLLALISNVTHGLQPSAGPPSNTSCISAVNNQGQFNETHTELTFLLSCDYSSLIISGRPEEDEPQSSTSGRFCQIIGSTSEDPYKKCICREEKGPGAVLRRCTVHIPIFENCTLLTSQVLEMRIFVNGHFAELVIIHVPIVDFTQWEQANCPITPTTTTNTTTTINNNNGKNNVSNCCNCVISNNNNKTHDDDDDDDKAILTIALVALAMVSFVSLCLHVIDYIVIGLWMKKQRTGENTPEIKEEPDRRDRSIPVRERSASGYEVPIAIDAEAASYIELN